MLKKIILYGIIGGFSALLDYITFYFFSTILNIQYIISNLISINVGNLTSFTLNRNFNYKTYDKKYERLLKFYIVSGVGILISTVLLYIFVTKLYYKKNIVKIATIPIVALVQFVLNTIFTFKKNEK